MPTPRLTRHARKIGDARLTMCTAIFALAWHLISAAQPVLAEHLGHPANAALSREKLKKLDTFFNDEVSAGKIPGAIVLIEQRDQPIYFKTFGLRDNDTGAPMTPDTIFPIHSMTKTITSFAVMMLIDQGRLRLDDPLAKFIPSFARVRVGVETRNKNGAPVLTLVPPRRPINIEYLLLHTSGITYESATALSTRPIPVSPSAILTMRSSPSGSPSCLWPSNRAHYGNMVIQSTFSAASSKSSRVSRCINSRRNNCSIPWACLRPSFS
jgi:CubicO group peptidase (beta-lactamase class C family)